MQKEIKHLEWYGVISEDGVVKSHKSVKHRNTYQDKTNHVCIRINKKTYRIKNLVASTFIRDWDSKHEEVVYIDGDKLNNHYTNLDIVPITNRLKLTQEAADLIREQYKAGHRKSALARQYKISLTTLDKVLNGKSWRS